MDAISCSHERSGRLHSVDLARAAVLDRGDLRAGTRGESLFLLRSPRRTCFLNNLSRPPRRTKYSSNAGESLARQFSTLAQACNASLLQPIFNLPSPEKRPVRVLPLDQQFDRPLLVVSDAGQQVAMAQTHILIDLVALNFLCEEAADCECEEEKKAAITGTYLSC